MTSKNLFFKRFKQDFEQRIWLPIILFIILFLFLEISLVSEFEWLNTRNDYYTRALDYLLNNFFTPASALCILTVAAAFFCALTGFSYLHSAKQLDVYHSLPIKREKLFVQQYVYGILYYVVPLLLHVLICLGIVTANGMFSGQVLGSAFGFLIFQILLFLANYSVSVLAVCLTGSAVISVLGSAVFMAYTLALEFISSQLMSDFFRTYYTYDEKNIIPPLSPLHLLYNFFISGRSQEADYYSYFSGIGYLALFLLMASIYAVIALLAYRKRASEAASRTIAFKIAEPVIKAMIVIPGTILVGYLFSTLASYGNNRVWFYFGCVFGFLICCPLMEIIFRKDVKAVFRHPLQFVFNGACVAAILIVLQFDLFGYDTYVPDDDKVESYALYVDSINVSRLEYGYSVEKILEEMALTENESVKALFSYAAQITRPVQLEKDAEENAVYTSLWAKYQLKNDKAVYRRYVININSEQVQYWLENIYEDMNFKKEVYNILDEENTNKYIGLSLDYNFGENMIFLPEEQMQQFLEIYKKELTGLTVRDMITSYPVARMGFVVPYVKDDVTYKEMTTTTQVYIADADWKEMYGFEDYWIESNYYIYPAFTETLDFLKSLGEEPQNEIPQENVISVRIEDRTYEVDDHDGLLTKLIELEYLPEDLTKSQLDQIFDNLVVGHMTGDFAALKDDSEEYVSGRIGYYDEEGFEQSQHFYFKEGMIPEFIQEDINEKAIEIGVLK